MSQPRISAQGHEPSDEVSLIDLWQVLRRSWRVIVATTGIALAAVVGFLLVTPAQYEAMGLIEVRDGVASVTPQKTVEYLQFPSSKQAVLRHLGWDDKGDRAAAFLASPPATHRKGTNLIDIRVRATTPSEALAALEATVILLAETHERLVQPTLMTLEQSLKTIRHEKEETLRLIRDYDRAAGLQARLEPRDRFSESLLYLQLVSTKQDRLAELGKNENEIEDKVRSIRGTPTQLMTEPAVNQQPVYPKAAFLVVLAMLGGTFLGAVICLFLPQPERA